MPIQDIRSRLQGKFRRTACRFFSRRQIQLKAPRAVVSFTFDDFPVTAATTGAAILEKHGVVGTYYVSLGLAGKIGPVGRYFSEPDLPLLLARGHELGCHTFDHCHAWNTEPDEYERSIIRNRERLHRILPGTVFAAHSYPISCPRPRTKTISANYFACSRGGEQQSNHGAADANCLNAFFVEKSRENLSAIKAQIDHAKTSSSWLIFATHDICAAPSPFGCNAELFEAIVRYTVEAGVSVLPVSQALAVVTG